MTIEHRFRSRAREVAAYLQSLLALERAHRTPGRGFYKAAEAIAASRASAFIMIYNCVEFGARETLVAIRQEIVASGSGYPDLVAYWQEEIVRAHFRERLSQGTNYMGLLRDFAGFGTVGLSWRSDMDKLPFSGNLDHEAFFALLKELDWKWRPPKSCLGGSDLSLVRQQRNALAHGQDAFVNVGAQFSTPDIVGKFRRIRTFMASLIRDLEKYRAQRAFLR